MNTPFKNINNLLDSLEVGIVVHNTDTSIQYINHRALELLRLTEAQAYGKQSTDPHWKFINDKGDKLLIENYPVNVVLKTQKPVNNLILGILDSQIHEPIWVKVNAFPEFDDENNLQTIVVNFIDISESQRSFSFENIVRLSNDIIVVTEAFPVEDSGPRIVYVNEAFVDLTGYTPDEVLGKTPRILQGPETDEKVKANIKHAITQGKPIRESILNYGKSGNKYWLDMNIFPLQNYLGKITHFVAIERDITEFKTREDKLRDNANTDPLTGLMNRRGFTELAEIIEANAKRYNHLFCIIAIDIDRFKSINDTYGHEAGDFVLTHLADIMRKVVRSSDLLGRLGGEEFAIVLPETDINQTTEIAERLRELIEKSLVTLPNNLEINITASFGVAQSNESNTEYARILKLADQALYDAKSKGRNRVIITDNTV